MNKKGEGNTLGVLIMLFIGIIVALALLGGMFEPVGDMTNIRTATNVTVTSAAAAAGTVTLPGRVNTSSLIVVNMTGDEPGEVWTVNFSISNTDSNDRLAILLVTDAAAVTAGQNGTSVGVSYTYEPEGYNSDSASRSMIDLVLIFAALAILGFVVYGVRDWL